VADTPYKIFIGGLPAHLNEGDIKKLLSMFGQLKSFNLVRDSITGLSKGFAFSEYADPSITDTACASLNGMAIGDKSLIVQRSSTNNKKPEGLAGPINPRAALMLTLSTPAAQLLATAVKNATAEPTKILVIMNILNLLDFPGDHEEAEFQEVLDDITQECSRYGQVVKTVVPRPTKKNTHHTVEHFDAIKWDDIGKDSDDEEEARLNPEVPDPPGLGKIFVEYSNVEEAKQAQTALSGRRFDGRMVVTSFHPEVKWAAGNLELDDIEDAAQQQRIQAQNELERKEKQALHPEILDAPQ
jgi:splicing factor U2AF subunit